MLIPEILETVRAHATVILTATPGAGKTTRLPPQLMGVVKGRILVLQPRRMATVAACNRICSENNWQVGREVGYQVRFESKVVPSTQLIFMTDALLLRRMIDDPELEGVDIVVIDEFHERNLNQDLILGALKELQMLGRDIKVVVMSATLDQTQLLAFFPGAAFVDVPGQVYPLEIRHSSLPLRLSLDFAFIERVAEAIRQASLETRGDILVFLPGVGEISRVQERLLDSGILREVVALHGSLPLSEQQKVLAPPLAPRVILATNVAEASVTVQGVDCVIDTGLAKVLEMNSRTGFSSLELRRIALFNARQRSGRAARQRSGVCIRLWTSHEEVTQIEIPTPECQRVDLSQAVLWLSHLGVREFTNFSWFDPPSGPNLSLSLRALYAIGALNAKTGELTSLGSSLLQMPIAPRWGVLLLEGAKNGLGAIAARVAALLSEKDFADRLETHANTECDVRLRLDLLRESRTRGVQEVLESSRQLERLVENRRLDSGQRGTSVSAGSSVSSAEVDLKLSRLLLLTQCDRLCRRRADSDRGLMVGGRGVRLNPRSQVRASEFFVALNGVDLPGKAETIVSIASGFSKEFVLNTLRDRIRIEEDVFFDELKGQFFARRQRYFEDLALDEPTLTQGDSAQLGDRMVEALATRWDWIVSQHERLGVWMKRFQFWSKYEVGISELLSEEKIRQVIEMAAFGKTKLSEVLAADLVGFMESVLEPSLVKKMSKAVPASFLAPSGVTHPIHYELEHGAYVEVRLQEIFGLQKAPRILSDQVRLTFRLLGPNYRPVQVTSDLENFWRSGYLEVRKELRSRYPKHKWPDDPLTAAPEAKGRRR